MDKHNQSNKPQDTGHEWDGIRELTNPPPRWWLISFHIGWIWCIIYFLLYPSIPLINGSNEGLLGWTQIKEFKEAVVENEAVKAPYMAKLKAMSAGEIMADAELRNFAESAAKAVYGDSCAACHGAGGEGAEGLFPVLADDDWLFGGDIDTIIETITEGRMADMPAHADMLESDQIEKLADFVVALPRGEATQEGWALFEEAGCMGCHGDNAKGGALNDDTFSGAANLTDQVWRFGGSREAVLRTIRYGVNQEDIAETRSAIMPAFGVKLTPEQIKILAIKVHAMGGGK
ncbi:cytochrome-c oxidase, cbb3-type subunit III [Mariprofundus sp. KV]|uniref:cytochrome-c oxidase, cbb3-type subunit III n=1 Tax=Mariprofundus sp. KV TaxID=2608715 RepID=UPI0015A3599A|nr:cytochrome-c oxidase, cbb3-type subunit III [Mariprofundus sp. KV]NWF37261.1 cytochrome-c oxidase, cbb3-type subunit III [Mariprofundus sp. KV]